MATREFEATTRIPTRPLSYANRDMAYNKELMIDYTNGNVYVKGEDGTIYDLSQTISNIIINGGGEGGGGGLKGDNIQVTVPDLDGEGDVTITIQASIIEIINKLKEHDTTLKEHEQTISEMQDIVDAITGGSGSGTGDVIQIKPGDIIVDANHQFVTNQQLTEIADKIHLQYVTVTLTAAGWTGSKAPYSQTVACAGALTDMARPTIDINHTAGESYENAMAAEDAWANIYRAVTGDGTITVYASDKPTVNISMVVELKLEGLTGVS